MHPIRRKHGSLIFLAFDLWYSRTFFIKTHYFYVSQQRKQNEVLFSFCFWEKYSHIFIKVDLHLVPNSLRFLKNLHSLEIALTIFHQITYLIETNIRIIIMKNISPHEIRFMMKFIKRMWNTMYLYAFELSIIITTTN